MPSPKPSEQTRSYLHLAGALRQFFRTLEVEVGGRLPPERELARRMNVSRPMLREALIVLELQGEIEIRVGSGIYLRQSLEKMPAKRGRAEPAHNEQLSALGQSPHEVNQMRYFLEGSIAAHAARFMNRSQLRMLKGCVDEMQQALDSNASLWDQAITEADRRLHVCLAQATGNQLVTSTVESLFNQRFSRVSSLLHQHFDGQYAWNDAVDEHREIYRAVADRDPLQAQVAMQRHLTLAHQRLMALIE